MDEQEPLVGGTRRPRKQKKWLAATAALAFVLLGAACSVVPAPSTFVATSLGRRRGRKFEVNVQSNEAHVKAGTHEANVEAGTHEANAEAGTHEAHAEAGTHPGTKSGAPALVARLNRELAHSTADTCDDASFAGCGILFRVFDWESDNVRLYEGGSFPGAVGAVGFAGEFESYPWLAHKVSTMLGHNHSIPDLTDMLAGLELVGNVGVVLNPQSPGAKPVCGYPMDGWSGEAVRQGVYDDGAGVSWRDGVDGCGACHMGPDATRDTPETSPECQALQYDYVVRHPELHPEWLTCPPPGGGEYRPCTRDQFNPGYPRSVLPESGSGAALPWTWLMRKFAENGRIYAEAGSWQHDQVGDQEILISTKHLDQHPDGLLALFIDTSSEKFPRAVAIANGLCATFNEEHGAEIPLLRYDSFPADGWGRFSLASTCRLMATPGAKKIRVGIEAAQQIAKGRPPGPTDEKQIWKLDHAGQFQNTCLSAATSDVSSSGYLPALKHCNGTAESAAAETTWLYDGNAHTLQLHDAAEDATSLCLTAPRQGEGALTIEACGSSAEQAFELFAYGISQIKSLATGLCVDVEDGVTWQEGGAMVLAPCVSYENRHERPSQMMFQRPVEEAWDMYPSTS